MKQEAEANADADKKAKEEIDKLNAADSMVFQVEKQMKEIEGKLPEDKQGPIDAALAELKAAHAAKDVAGCDAAQEKLNGALKRLQQKFKQQCSKTKAVAMRSY